MLEIDWTHEFASIGSFSQNALVAETFAGVIWPSFSRPALFICNDGNKYVVKGAQVGRGIINEQIVASLGQLIDAPIPTVRIIDIPKELRDAEPNLAYMQHGLSHGIAFQENCSDRRWGANQLFENIERYASIVVLYNWIPSNDNQLIFRLSPPEIVYSVDHGHFFFGGPNWTTASLDLSGSVYWTTPRTRFPISISDVEIAIRRLNAVSPNDIARAIARLPAEWGMTAEENVKLATYLERRRIQLLALPVQ